MVRGNFTTVKYFFDFPKNKGKNHIIKGGKEYVRHQI